MSDQYRLPDNVTPSHYDLRLQPDLDGEAFAGSVGVDIALAEPSTEITCNADGLQIVSATVISGDDSQVATVELDAERERVTFTVANAVPAGPARLEVEFSGQFNPQLVGFYLSRFTDADGNDAKLATTQFEATHARKAFPCWDEPASKATFAITLEIDADHNAVSNAAEVSRTVLPNGNVEVAFAPTISMSTYLVAFVVGPLVISEPVDANGVAVRVVHVAGNEHLTEFALDAGAFGLNYFADYFGISYPGDKCDLVAIPDFAFGAMENLGCITFREVLLLIDPERASLPELQRAADVIFHELAHMWFGDLVTMKWWNGLWLNEAFATFMEMKATDAYRPEWARWTDFGISRAAAFDTDALTNSRPIEFEVVSPADAEAMFDILTYEKGASVVRMLEQYLSPEVFRTGIRLYMDTHAYANTDTGDLWAALEQASGEPVQAIMDGWIFQPGCPVIEVTTDPAGVVLSQEPLAYAGSPEADADRGWMTPVAWREIPKPVPADHDPNAAANQRLLLSSDPETIAVASGLAVVNAGAHSFVRIGYDSATLGQLADVALDALTPVERFGLVDDAWASVLADRLGSPSFVNLLESLSAETDTSVAQRLLAGWRSLDRWLSGDARDELGTIVHDALAPTLASVGLEPDDDDDDRRRQLRAELIKGLAVLANDGEMQRHCAEMLARADQDPSAVDAALVPASVTVVAATGDDADFSNFVDRWRNASNPQEEMRYLYALADFDQPSTAAKVLEMISAQEIRSQNTGLLLNRMIGQRDTGRTTFEWVRNHWAELNDYLPTSMIDRMVGSLPTLDTAQDAAVAAEFFAANPIPQAAKTLQQILERQRVAVAAREREAERLSSFLVG